MEGKIRKAIKDLGNANPATQSKSAQILEDLFTKTPSSRKAFLTLGGVGPLVNACSGNKDRSVVERCLAVMHKLTSIESEKEVWEVFVKVGAVPMLVVMCDDMYDYAHATIAAILDALCTDGAAGASAISTDGFVRNLVAMCRHTSDPRVATRAAMLVGTLCLATGHTAQAALEEGGVVPPLVEMCKGEGGGLGGARVEALRALQGVTLRDEKLDVVPLAGGIPPLVRAAKYVASDSDDPALVARVHMHAAGVLRNLARDVENRQRIVDAGGLPALVGLCSHVEPKVVVEAAGALRRCCLTAQIGAAVSALDAVNVLLPLCTPDAPDAVLVEAVSTLGNIALEHSEARDEIGEADGVVVLTALLAHENVDVCIQSVMSLRRVCIDHPDNRERACVAGSMPILVGLLKHPHPDVQVVTCEAITQLVFEHSRNKIAINRHDGFPALIPLMRSSVPLVTEKAAEAMNAACIEVDMNQSEALRVGSVAPLVQLSRSQLIRVRNCALQALSTLGVNDPRPRASWPLEPRIPPGFCGIAPNLARKAAAAVM